MTCHGVPAVSTGMPRAPVRSCLRRPGLAQEMPGDDTRADPAAEIFHHELAPNVDTFGAWGWRRYPVHTNGLGFKAAATGEVALRSDHERILFIGDSFTEGIGVAYPDTFVGQVGASLAAEGVEVLNAGVVSYAPSIYWRKTRYLLDDVGLGEPGEPG